MAARAAYLDRADAIARDYVAGLGPRVGEFSDPAAMQAHDAAVQALLAEASLACARPELVGFGVAGPPRRKAAEMG